VIRPRGEPVVLGDALAALGRELGVPSPATLRALADVWPDVVGGALARHSRVRSVRDGECVVEVDGPAWATQLRYLENDLVERAARACGPGVVSSVRVVVARG